MMKSILFFATILLCANTFSQTNDAFWEAIGNSDRLKAREIIEPLVKSGKATIDDYVSLMFLNEMEGQYTNLSLTPAAIKKTDNPSPYLFSLWFTSAVTNGYGKHSDERSEFLSQLLEMDNIHYSLKASLKYNMGFHQLLSNKGKQANKTWAEVGSIKDWSFVGTFDNTSGSGFDKKHEPITTPSEDAIFKSKTNSDIHWFTPSIVQSDPWITVSQILTSSQGVNFAQTFLDNPVEQEVNFSIGFEGSIKVWVNGNLILSEEEERKTELDTYSKLYLLPKGKNRVLIQLSHTSESNEPYFILRLLDKNNAPIENITANHTPVEYNKDNQGKLIKDTPLFAETFFEKEIANNPNNPINYILLSKVYYRSKKHNQAIKTLKDGLKLQPNNLFLHFQLILNYQKMKDRTILLRQVEELRRIDPELLFLAYYDYSTALENEDFETADEKLKIIGGYKGIRSETYLNKEIELLGKKKDFQVMMSKIEQAYSLHPTNTTFNMFKFYIEKQKKQSNAVSLSILEKFLKKEYNYKINNLLLEEYFSLGYNDKAIKLLSKNANTFPEEVSFLKKFITYYYNINSFGEAKKYINKAIGMQPFESAHWSDRAFINLALNNTEEAIHDFKKTIHYNPNSFDAREKLRSLQEKETLMSYFENEESDSQIEKYLKDDGDYDDQYFFIFNKKHFIQFEEGASVEFNSLGIKINTKSGVDTWSEASIPVNGMWQRLIVEKAEIHKPNGQKIEAEKNYNQMVFPSLEEGDVILIEYRIENYTGGKLAKELTLEHVFNGFVPIDNSELKIYLPLDYNINIVSDNKSAIPAPIVEDEFKTYSWKFDNTEKCKDEDFMPSISEVGDAVSVSSIDSWKVISDWYRDLAMPMTKEDYNVKEVYNEIFAEGENLNDTEKAKLIYNYIVDNINYSSISFRQSNFVPQKPMVTLSTKLGDCKDMSTLFLTLARKAGLNTNLVLVNTRENGENTMRTPSIQFNHCIVRVSLDGKDVFQDLTASKLPFGILPNTVLNAEALVIPNSAEDKVGENLIKIPNNNIRKNKIVRNTTINAQEDELEINTVVLSNGVPGADYRYYFEDLSSEDEKYNIESVVKDYFENSFKVNSYKIEDMEDRDKDASLTINFNVENEIKNIGTLKVFKVPFFEEIMSLSSFPDEKRNYPLLFWKYESTEYYETNIVINVPSTFEISEVPENLTIKNNFIDYNLTFEKTSPTSLKVTRVVHPYTGTITPEDYNKFRDMIKSIIKAEDVFIAYKEKK